MAWRRPPIHFDGRLAQPGDFDLVEQKIEVFINSGWKTQDRLLTQVQLTRLSDGQSHRWTDDDGEEIVMRLSMRSRK